VSGSFEDFVDLEGLGPEERERLRGVHELLIQAGPPPELPASLATLPADAGGARVIPFRQGRRRFGVALLLAAAIAGAAFGGGYLVGHHGGSASAVRVVTMTGTNALASLQVRAPDSSGNWPIDVSVTGLPEQSSKYAYYELFLVKHGKPTLPCGGFRSEGGTTNVHFSVPYEVTSTSRWVVTAIDHNDRWPGRTVMT
jgi:hypothetical protein